MPQPILLSACCPRLLPCECGSGGSGIAVVAVDDTEDDDTGGGGVLHAHYYNLLPFRRVRGKGVIFFLVFEFVFFLVFVAVFFSVEGQVITKIDGIFYIYFFLLVAVLSCIRNVVMPGDTSHVSAVST